MSAEKEVRSARGISMSFVRELYRITKHYTAAAEAIPNPREVDLETFTVVDGEDSELEYQYCQRSSCTEWANVTVEEIMREFDNYPEHIIPKDENKEKEIRQQYLDCVNRTVTLFQDIESSEGYSSDEIPNDELFEFSIDRPIRIYRSYPANASTEEAPEDNILETAIVSRPLQKQVVQQTTLGIHDMTVSESPGPAGVKQKRSATKQPYAALEDMANNFESPKKKRRTK